MARRETWTAADGGWGVSRAWRLLSPADGLAAVCLGVQPAHAQNTWLTIQFDTRHLGAFPMVSGSGYGVWSNGLTVSDANIYASFEWTNSAPPVASSTNPDGTPKQHTNFFQGGGGPQAGPSAAIASGVRPGR